MLRKPIYDIKNSIINPRDVIVSTFPEEELDFISKFIADTVRYAANINQSNISLNFRKDTKKILFNVGKVTIFTISKNGLQVTLNYEKIQENLKSEIDISWQNPKDRPSVYPNIKNSCKFIFSVNDLKRYQNEINLSLRAVIDEAIVAGKNIWVKSNSIESLNAIQELSNLEMPNLDKSIDNNKNKIIDQYLSNRKEDALDLVIESYSDFNFETRVVIDFNEELAEKIILGDLGIFNKIKEKIENELYE